MRFLLPFFYRITGCSSIKQRGTALRLIFATQAPRRHFKAAFFENLQVRSHTVHLHRQQFSLVFGFNNSAYTSPYICGDVCLHVRKLPCFLLQGWFWGRNWCPVYFRITRTGLMERMHTQQSTNLSLPLTISADGTVTSNIYKKFHPNLWIDTLNGSAPHWAVEANRQ